MENINFKTEPIDDIKTNMPNISTLGTIPPSPSLNTEFAIKIAEDTHIHANQPNNNHNQTRNPQLFVNNAISKPIITKEYSKITHLHQLSQE